MAAPMRFNVFIGTELGLLKGYDYIQNVWENINSVTEAGKCNEICALCWDSNLESNVCLGLKSNRLLTYSIHEHAFKEEISVDFGEGKVRNIFKLNECFVSAVSSGSVKLWEDSLVKSEFTAGKDLFVMDKCSNQENLIATGGKENDLKLWDINNHLAPIFQAKNVRNDWLNLRVPVWIVKCSFLKQPEKIVTSTGYHQVRLYDTKAQRRPVVDMTFGEYPLTALAINHFNIHQVIVGNTQGQMALLDIRKGAMVQQYKGFAGGIRDIKCPASKPVIVSCGLDRHLRVHDINSKLLLNKVYLKSRLNCLLLKTNGWDLEVKDEVLDAPTCKEEKEKSDDEELWNNMQVIKTKTKRKTETQNIDSSSTSKEISSLHSNMKKRKVKKQKIKS